MRKILKTIPVILLLSMFFVYLPFNKQVKAEDFNVSKILFEMLNIKNKATQKGKKELVFPTFSTAVFPISFEAAFRAAMLVEMSLGRVPVTVDKVAGILTTSDSPLKMLSGSVFVSYYFEPIGRNKTRVCIRTKAFHFSEGFEGIGGGWDLDDKNTGRIIHFETVLLYVIAAKAKRTEVRKLVKELSEPKLLINSLKEKFKL